VYENTYSFECVGIWPVFASQSVDILIPHLLNTVNTSSYFEYSPGGLLFGG
jgi:hypothetical protein